MVRVLCLRLPDWPVQRWQVERRDSAGGAADGAGPPRLAIVRYRDARRGECVAACCAAARRAGVRVGMPLSEALTLARKLTLAKTVGAPQARLGRPSAQSSRVSGPRPASPTSIGPLPVDLQPVDLQPVDVWAADPAADAAAFERLAEQCEQFSPVVGWETVEGSGAVRSERDGGHGGHEFDAERLLLDVTGIGPLFGSESALVAAVLATFRQLGYVAHAAIADTLGAAWALTVAWEGRAEEFCERIVPPGETAGALDPLPLAALRLPAETVDSLRQLGVTRVEQLRRLPRGSLAARFGLRVLTRLDQASGGVRELIRPYRPPPQFQADWRLEEPTDNEPALGGILRKLLERIAADLAPRGQGVVQLVVRLDLAAGRPLLVRLNLFRPSAVPRHWEELVRLRWERLSRGGLVGRVTVQATLTAPLELRQRELFAVGPADQTQVWGGLLERLASRLGDDAVLAVELRRAGLPEQDYVYRPWVRRRGASTAIRPPRKTRRRGAGQAASNEPTQGKIAADETPRTPGVAPSYRPLAVEATPRPLETLSVAPYGPPMSFRWRREWRQVARWWGPERLETGWWHGPSVRRDYYRVETTTGDRWWLFRDLAGGGWFLHGSFD